MATAIVRNVDNPNLYAVVDSHGNSFQFEANRRQARALMREARKVAAKRAQRGAA